jgi:hypothetical protein
MATFGLDSGNATEAVTPSYAVSTRVQNTVGDGNLSKIELLVDDASPLGNVKFAVYADSGGEPGALLLDGGDAVAVTNGWVSKSGLTLAVTLNTWYFLFFKMDQGNDVRYLSSGSNDAYKYNEIQDPWPSPFGAPGGHEAHFVLRATVDIVGDFPYAGNIPVAFTPNTPIGDLWNSLMFKWCDEGESSIGDVYLRGQAQPDLYLGLYKNNTEPAEDDTMADITEASTPGTNGYDRIQLADGDWTETSQGTFTNLQKTFTCATSNWGDVYGYFITTTATGTAGKLITAEQFTDGPYLTVVGDQIKVTPKITFG